MLAFPAFLKAGDAAILTQSREFCCSPGQNLMRIALMADIEEDLVYRRMKHIMERNGQLDDSEIAGQMPSCF